MKKLLVIFATLLLLTCLLFGTTVIASAETSEPNASVESEVTLPSTDDIIDNMGGNFDEEEKQFIKDLVDKVKAYTESSDSFFVRIIVPILIAIGLCLLFGIIILIPWLRNKLKLKDAENMLKNAKEHISACKDEITELKKQVDINTIKEEIKQFIKQQWETMGVMVEDTLKKNGVEIDKIESCLESLIKGAINAWHGSPEAVACLTSVADATTLKNLAEENAKLMALVYKKYGEDASREIASL